MENNAIEDAKKEFDKIIQDEHERALAESRMKYIMDMNAIRDYGYDHGKEDEKIRIAKNMLKANYSIEEIIKLTGLSKEEIEKLK